MELCPAKCRGVRNLPRHEGGRWKNTEAAEISGKAERWLDEDFAPKESRRRKMANERPAPARQARHGPGRLERTRGRKPEAVRRPKKAKGPHRSPWTTPLAGAVNKVLIPPPAKIG